MSAGTGVETRTAQQVFLMREFGATCIVGFADYIRRLADAAREAGLEPGRDLPIRLICAHLGSETQASLGAAWGGAQVYDWYGVGDTGIIAGEGPDRSGMHVLRGCARPRTRRPRHRRGRCRTGAPRRHGLHLPVQGRHLPDHPLQHA